MKRLSSVPILLAFSLLGAVVIARAQEGSYPASEQTSQGQLPPQQAWAPDQLDNLVAPIALYPDPLLGQIVVASTYPLEVVEANQWLQRNRNLRGQQLIDAARQQPWDPSVQALVAVPDALARLSQDIPWTTDLGNAFLAQQADVMSAVQRMRSRAQANGRLYSTPQQTVTTQEQGGQQVIIIQFTSGDLRYTATTPGLTTPDSASISDRVSTSVSILVHGEVGAAGDGARAGSATRSMSTTTSSTAMDFISTTGTVLGGERSGLTIRFIACTFRTGTLE